MTKTAGMLAWPEVLERVKSAALVVANNSGLAHLSAELGTPTISKFGASHSPCEWMARGPRSTIVIKETACSPCSIDVVKQCPYGMRRLSQIDAQTVFDTGLARLNSASLPSDQPDTANRPDRIG